VTQPEAVLRAAGRQRNLGATAEQISATLRTKQLTTLPLVAPAFGASVAAQVAVTAEPVRQTASLEASLTAAFEQHPSTEILRSLPGLGVVLGAGRSRSSGTTRTATPMLKPARTTRGQPRSPARRASARSSWPGTSPTAGSPTRATSGRSAPSPAHPAPARSTTPSVPEEPTTTQRSARWLTGSSACCTAAYDTAPPTTKAPRGRDCTRPTNMIKEVAA
jgi:hypothetical protein